MVRVAVRAALRGHDSGVSMREPIRIWGLGSDHGDDRIGWAVVETLVGDAVCGPYVRTARAPWDLLLDDPWPRRMIVVDAAQLGRAAGAIVETTLGSHAFGATFRVGDAASQVTTHVLRSSRGSSHGAGLAEILELARQLGRSVDELVLLAVEIQQCEPGSGLSDPARHALPRVVRRVRELASEWLQQDAC
jgi:hydrogenase maturation protease